MSLVKSLSALAVLGVAASAANAGISARWVTIQGATNQPAGATTYSLVVDLTGSSLFNVAGLQAILPAGSSYFNQVPFGTDTKPSAALIAVFPDLAFDTYVSTTNDAQAPAIPGRYVGPGAAIVGAGQEFNVAWGATPNTGPTGGTGLEIARLTVLGGGAPAVNGEVRSSDDPNTAVAIPPIPEPATLGLAALGLGLVSLRRR